MTIFAKILSGEIPADKIHEDDRCIAFRDIAPQAPHHVLVIPRKPIVSMASAGPEDAALLGHLMLVAAQVARDLLPSIEHLGAGAGQIQHERTNFNMFLKAC